MGEVRDSFRLLWALIFEFAWNPIHEDAHYSHKVLQWHGIAAVSSESLRHFEELSPLT